MFIVRRSSTIINTLEEGEGGKGEEGKSEESSSTIINTLSLLDKNGGLGAESAV